MHLSERNGRRRGAGGLLRHWPQPLSLLCTPSTSPPNLPNYKLSLQTSLRFCHESFSTGLWGLSSPRLRPAGCWLLPSLMSVPAHRVSHPGSPSPGSLHQLKPLSSWAPTAICQDSILLFSLSLFLLLLSLIPSFSWTMETGKPPLISANEISQKWTMCRWSHSYSTQLETLGLSNKPEVTAAWAITVQVGPNFDQCAEHTQEVFIRFQTPLMLLRGPLS